jgi:hypothetical protein
LRRAAALAPDDPQILFWAARRETLMGQPLEAERHLQQALARQPSHAGAQLALGMLYLDDKTGTSWPAGERKKRAADAFGRLGEIAITATEYNAVAIFHLITTGVERAVGPAGKACDLDPSCWSCLHTYAEAMFQSGEGESAAITLQLAALSRLPDDAPERIVKALSRDLERYRAGGDPSVDRHAGTMLFWPD